MRSSGYWRWQRGGYSGRDRPAPPRVRRTGALNRRPIRACAAAPETRRRAGQWRAPGVPHGRDADFGAEMFGIGCDCPPALGGALAQEIVDHRLVLVGAI